jgi:hypothetical protein
LNSGGDKLELIDKTDTTGDRTVGHSIASVLLPASDFGFQQRRESVLAMCSTDAVWIDLDLIRRPVITLLSRHHVRKSAIGIERSTLSKARSNKPSMRALPRTIGDEYLLRRQRWNRFDPITILAMTTLFYIWNRSFVAYDRFIFFFWIDFLSMDSCLTRTTWMASTYLLSLKRVQATTKTRRQFNRSLADDDIYHHQSVILSYLLDSIYWIVNLSLASLGQVYFLYNAIARPCAKAALNVEGRPSEETSCLQQGKLRPTRFRLPTHCSLSILREIN